MTNKTDEQYIREAAALAKGWCIAEEIEGDSYWLMYVEDDGWWSEASSRWFQIGLDALAAQLVRQVDAKQEIYVTFSTQGTWCRVADAVRCSDVTVRATAKGPDRTMNSIRAIVDSGVLENE